MRARFFRLKGVYLRVCFGIVPRGETSSGGGRSEDFPPGGSLRGCRAGLPQYFAPAEASDCFPKGIPQRAPRPHSPRRRPRWAIEKESWRVSKELGEALWALAPVK